MRKPKRSNFPPMTANSTPTIGTLRTLALTLWQDGWRINPCTFRPLNAQKPVTPSAIADAVELPYSVAVQVCHLLNVWSLGSVPVGEFDRI
jgi:hypothetical protein